MICKYANFVPEFPVKCYDVQNKHILPWTKLIYFIGGTNNYHKTCLTGSLRLAPRRLLIPGYPERNGNTKPSQWYKMLTLFANCNLIFFIFVLHAYYTCHIYAVDTETQLILALFLLSNITMKTFQSIIFFL